MAFQVNKQTSALQAIESAIKYEHLTSKQGDLIKTICRTNKVPVGSHLYIPFEAFCEFLAQAIPFNTLLVNARSIFTRAYPSAKIDDFRKDMAKREPMSAFRCRVNKVPRLTAATINCSLEIPGVVIVNSVYPTKYYNHTKDLEDFPLDVIYPKLTAMSLQISAVNAWVNPVLGIVYKRGMSIYITFNYLYTFMQNAIFKNTPIVFNFFPIEKGIPSMDLIIEPQYLAMSRNINELHKVLIDHGVMEKKYTIAKIEINDFSSMVTVTVIDIG